MKKAICLISKNITKTDNGLISKAQEYADSKGYQFDGCFYITKQNIIGDITPIINFLSDQKIDIILSGDETSLYIDLFVDGKLLTALKEKGIQWYNIMNDSLIQNSINDFIKDLEEKLEKYHIPILVISGETDSYEKDMRMRKIMHYVKDVLNEEALSVIRYYKDTEGLESELTKYIMFSLPRYIIVEKDVENEGVKMLMKQLKEQSNYDMVITYDEIEQYFQDNEFTISFTDIKN